MDVRSCLLFLIVFIRHASAKCGVPSSNDTCLHVSDLNCKDCEGTVDISNPFDCRSYYICKGKKLAFPNSFDCPDGEIFKDTHCVPESSCKPICPSPGKGKCLYSCGAMPGKPLTLADPYNCSTFYQCKNGSAGLPQNCPSETPYFDGEMCQKNITHCCSCHPYCYSEDIGHYVPDPTDCRNYYACLKEGIPTDISKCPGIQHFDIMKGECSLTARCSTLCWNVVRSDGCIDPFICTHNGIFAKCINKCVPEYYYCDFEDIDYQSTKNCTNGNIFNPKEGYCTPKSNCPFK